MFSLKIDVKINKGQDFLFPAIDYKSIKRSNTACDSRLSTVLVCCFNKFPNFQIAACRLFLKVMSGYHSTNLRCMRLVKMWREI